MFSGMRFQNDGIVAEALVGMWQDNEVTS